VTKSGDDVEAEELKRLRLLARQGVGWSKQAELDWAVLNDRLRVVRFLVDEGDADVNAQDYDGSTALMLAVRGGHLDVVRILVNNCCAYVNVQNSKGLTALTMAARGGHMDIVRFLVNEGGADGNIQSNDRSAALMKASRAGHADIVRFLVHHGADVNIQDKDGYSVLMKAAGRGHVHVARVLVNEGGTRVNIQTNYGSTALVEAARGGHVDVVRFLVHEGGADVNIHDKDGFSALMLAAARDHLYVVRFLVNEGGADVNLKNYEAHTALRIASDYGHNDIVRLLTQFALPTHRSLTCAGLKSELLASDTSRSIDIPPSEVELGQFFEEGNIGGDFRVKWLGADAVAKLFIPDASASTLEQEVRAWQELRHPNVLKLYGVCQAAPTVNFFVCEYASQGALAEYTMSPAPSTGGSTKPLTWKFLYEATLGMEYLHERGIIHGDLRCSNILIGNDGMAKLSNFGSTGVANHAHLVIRSMRWQAPEVLEGSPASRESDVYSLGMCILEAATGEPPWSTSNELVTQICKLEWNADAHASAPYDQRYHNGPCRGDFFIRRDDPLFVRRSRELVWRMCCRNPHERSSLTSIISELEQLSIEGRPDALQPESEPESASCFEGYKGEGAEEQWQKLHECMANCDNAEHCQVFEKLQIICERLQESEHSCPLLDRFYSLVTDFYQTVKMAPEEVWAMQLSSRRATTTSLISFSRRVHALLKALGESVPEETEQTSWQQQRREQGAAFVSGIADAVLLLQSLTSVEEQAALLESLRAEMESVEDKYTDEQLRTMKETYEAIEGKLATEGVEDAATLTPKWFIPWYELIIGEVFGGGSFGSVRRAKWLDSDVVVKEVLLPGSDRPDSSDSLYDSVCAARVQAPTDPQTAAKRAEAQAMCSAAKPTFGSGSAIRTSFGSSAPATSGGRSSSASTPRTAHWSATCANTRTSCGPSCTRLPSACSTSMRGRWCMAT
jgi:ankyrin repeat protein